MGKKIVWYSVFISVFLLLIFVPSSFAGSFDSLFHKNRVNFWEDNDPNSIPPFLNTVWLGTNKFQRPDFSGFFDFLADNLTHGLPLLDNLRDRIRDFLNLHAPENISLLSCDKAVIVNWTQSTDSYFTGCNIYRADSLEGPYDKLNKNTIKGHGYLDAAVENGKTYYYKLSSVAFFSIESSFSSPLPAMPEEPNTEEKFLEMISRAAFHYFWYEADPASGLVPYQMSQPRQTTSGATGFGLTSLVIGARRGWITREEAAARALKTLDFLYTETERVNGFFSRWINSDQDNNREYRANIWESSLLFAGALTCREFFSEDNEQEEQIRTLAEQLYTEAQWDRVLTGNGYALARHWPPVEDETGNCPDIIEGYTEAMLAYILAIGSPTHRIDTECYEKGWAKGYNPREGAFNLILDAGRVTEPLSIHQYSHCWLDFKGKWDGYANYFENARKATLINQRYCLENLKNWNEEYGEGLWGLTTCECPGGFVACGPFTGNDDTFAPAAVAGSMPFTPEKSLSTLRYMYDYFRKSLWEQYGFLDAVNPAAPSTWVARDYYGMNEGLMILMIENYRSGIVWELTAKNEWISSAMNAIFSIGHDQAPEITLVYPVSDPNNTEINGKELPIIWRCDDSDIDGITLQFSCNVLQNQLLIDDFEDNECFENSLGKMNFIDVGVNGRMKCSICEEDTYPFSCQSNHFCLKIEHGDKDPLQFSAQKSYRFIMDGLDASVYDELTFLLKGTTGKEHFRFGLKDTDQNEFLFLVHTFLPEGRITREWQRVIVPLNRFKERSAEVNLASLENCTLHFDDVSGEGTIFIDDLRLIKWGTMAANEPNDGSYRWDISKHVSAQEDHLLIRLIAKDKAGNIGEDQSSHYLFLNSYGIPRTYSLTELVEEKGGCFIDILGKRWADM